MLVLIEAVHVYVGASNRPEGGEGRRESLVDTYIVPE